MSDTQTPEVFLPLRRAAAQLGVPAAWLRAEAHAGRVPYLRAGRRLLLNTDMVERELRRRAEREARECDRDT